jgi:hypothetical protein
VRAVPPIPYSGFVHYLLHREEVLINFLTLTHKHESGIIFKNFEKKLNATPELETLQPGNGQ